MVNSFYQILVEPYTSKANETWTRETLNFTPIRDSLDPSFEINLPITNGEFAWTAPTLPPVQQDHTNRDESLQVRGLFIASITSNSVDTEDDEQLDGEHSADAPSGASVIAARSNTKGRNLVYHLLRWFELDAESELDRVRILMNHREMFVLLGQSS